MAKLEVRTFEAENFSQLEPCSPKASNRNLGTDFMAQNLSRLYTCSYVLFEI
jgi:hypothetical protein